MLLIPILILLLASYFWRHSSSMAAHSPRPSKPEINVGDSDDGHNLVWSNEGYWVPAPPTGSDQDLIPLASIPPPIDRSLAEKSPSNMPPLQADDDMAAWHESGENVALYLASLRPFNGTLPSRPLVALVTGEAKIINRDLPLLKKGYEDSGLFARISTLPSSRRPVPLQVLVANLDADVVLCLSLRECASDEEYRLVVVDNPHLRFNRLPGLREVLWSKQNFCIHVPESVAKLISFHPCFVLPQQWDEFRAQSQDKMWIAKPWASGGGNGISLGTGPTEIEKWQTSKLVVQPLLLTPLLLSQVKTDLRTFALVTNISPLRAYLHSQGLVRLAGAPFVQSGETSYNRSRFLTNVSVNKKSFGGDASLATRPLEHLWEAVGPRNARILRLGMDRAVGLLLLSVENTFHTMHNVGAADSQLFALLGVDIIIDSSDLSVRVIEINGEPSFEASNGTDPHYTESKVRVQRDVAATVFSSGPLRSRAQDYIAHLNHERAVITSAFRALYPSPLCAVSKANNALFESVMLQSDTRLNLHRQLNALERNRVSLCLFKKMACSSGYQNQLRDLFANRND